MSERIPDAVVLVHGTFVDSKDDEGPGWWQRGTRNFAGWLDARLGGSAVCDRVFHWNGENKERRRRRAGHELLARLRGYESEGRPYHLVGHSHGGSVIWSALRDAARGEPAGKELLPNLRSWTTVGAPFMTYRTRWSELLFLIPIALAIPLLATVMGQAEVVRSHFGELWSSPVAPWADRWPLLGLAATWMVALGVFGFAANRLRVLALAAIGSRADAKADLRAARAFRDRGRCLWSSEDEAINGLRTTLVLHDLRRHEAREGPASPEGGSTGAGKPVRILPRKDLASRIYGPLADQFFFEILKQFLQGNDLPGRRLAAVTAEPPGFAAEPALTEAMQHRLELQVTDGIVRFPETLHRLRRVLGDVAYGGQLQSPFETGPGRASPAHAALMIHTMYFPEARHGDEADADDGDACSPIPRLIFDRIRRAAGSPAGESATDPVDDGIGPVGPSPTLRVDGSSPRARLKALMVPATVSGACALLLILPAVAGPRLFDRVLPFTDEGKIRDLIREDFLLALDAASDGSEMGPLADFALAMADAEARKPLRRRGAGASERRVVPSVVISGVAGIDAINLVDEPRLRAGLLARDAMALAKADPPRVGLARDYAEKAVIEARVDPASDPGTAVEVLVLAARVHHRIKDDPAVAIGLVDEAAKLATNQVASRFLQLRSLDSAVKEHSRREFQINAPPSPPSEPAPPAPIQGDLRPGNLAVQSRPPSKLKSPSAPPPPPAPERKPIPGDYIEPMAVSPIEQALANRMAMQVIDAARLRLEMGDLEPARRLLEGLIADYRDVENMGQAKGNPSYFWSFGLAEELGLVSALAAVGLEAKHPSFKAHLVRLLPTIRYSGPADMAWLALGEQATALKESDLAGVVAEAARGILIAYRKEVRAKSGMESPDRDGLAAIASTMKRLGEGDLAREFAALVLDDLGRFRPSDSEVEQTRYPNVFYQTYYKRAVDRYPLYRIGLRLKVARLGPLGSPVPSPASLIEDAWKEAVAMESRAAQALPVKGMPMPAAPTMGAPTLKRERDLELTAPEPDTLLSMSRGEAGFERVSRATALAEIIATAAHLPGEDAPGIRDWVVEQTIKLADDGASRLTEESWNSAPFGIALRHLVAGLAEETRFDRAMSMAERMGANLNGLSARLFVIDRLARSGEARRGDARRLLYREGETIDISRRIDWSPRLAQFAAIGATLGETRDAIGWRKDCLTVDRLRADTIILSRFALGAGEDPAVEMPDVFKLPPVFDNGDARLTRPIVLSIYFVPPSTSDPGAVVAP